LTEKQTGVVAQRPASPGIETRNGGGVQPWQLDPELAQIEIARLMISQMGRPSIISKEFIVRSGLFKTLNHRRMAFNADNRVIDMGNQTGLDMSLRVNLYDYFERGSINQDGVYFNNFWAWSNKPKYIIQGGNVGLPVKEEEKESLFGRAINWFRGGKKNDTAQQ